MILYTPQFFDYERFFFTQLMLSFQPKVNSKYVKSCSTPIKFPFPLHNLMVLSHIKIIQTSPYTQNCPTMHLTQLFDQSKLQYTNFYNHQVGNQLKLNSCISITKYQNNEYYKCYFNYSSFAIINNNVLICNSFVLSIV
jgi:hypothetical protein